MSTTTLSDDQPRSLGPLVWALSVIVHCGLVFLLATSAGTWFGPVGTNDGAGIGETFHEVGVVVESRKANDRQATEDGVPADPTERASGVAASQVGAPDSEVPAEAPARLELPSRTTAGIGAGSLLPTRSGAPTDVGDLVRGGAVGSPGALSGLAPGETRFFGIADKGSRIVYLIDISGSMAGAKLTAARAQLLASIETLLPQQQFQVLFYNQTVHPMVLAGNERQNVYKATDINKTKTRQALASVRADEGTDRESALMAALGYGPDVVYFLTDGDGVELDRVRRNRILERNREGARIHCIEFGPDTAPTTRNALGRLALENGGVYRYVRTGR